VTAKTKSSCKLRLSGELTVRTIADAQQKLLAVYAKHERVVVDTSAVNDADLTLVQLIDAARRSSIIDGKHLALSPPPSAALHDVLQRGGFLGAGEGASFWKGE
jgi:ABC-type transporter Mla MlaB component